MSFEDPFTGYSLVLRTIVYVLVPAFTVWQLFRLRRALHVFQLEGYKRDRFLSWCREHRDASRWLRNLSAKKPLVMTGRAARILIVATVLSPLLILVPAGLAHLWLGGWPADVAVWAAATCLVFFFTSRVLTLADFLLSPVQNAINNRFLKQARAKLSRIDPLVVGITGSFGKTSTKFATAALIGEPGEVLATPGSFNTPLGVCRTINESLADHHRCFIVEMGAYGVGEIAELCRFVRPTIGVLTAVGPAHVDRFGSMENIKRAKYELIQSLPRDGNAVMNVDDPVVRELADATTHVPVVRYGLDSAARPHVTAADVELNASGTSLQIIDVRNGAELRAGIRLLGRHSIGHVLAGTAVALAAGRRLEDLSVALSLLEPVDHRLKLIQGTGGVTVIDDAYNSNPEGAAAALEVLATIPGNKKVVVTPGMVELGPLQAEANARFGEAAAKAADVLIVVAPINREAITSGAARAVPGAEVVAVDTLADATRRLQSVLKPGDVVLFENDLPGQYEG